ncbi:hypothetical protein CYMTET_22797 [Cymbomonas tetramitiformis]|uniref:EGF-like domain-containing protein n=1 Tax=Cymbomonas tetramitiformis TaxID=36881 RepID=A0AAE0L1X6_9CHLO|nr:hypothetical protein CYMTET_22797 [Cymbomonas tetramitiformis]
MHQLQQCPECVLQGNAVEHSQQRAVVVHGTHLATVEHNVAYDVRGASYYIEDGNELYNRFAYNVALCPFALEGPLHGCTIPGTDNGEADTSLNQAGFWSMGHRNDFEGNRAANSFNGLLFHSSFAPNGRGGSRGHVCAPNVPFGRIVGNTNHGHGRFGFYVLVDVYPRDVAQPLENNGWTEWATCEAHGDAGEDRGVPVAVLDNLDYHNTWMGSYNLGDLQYLNSYAADSVNNLYWKESKNMADSCAATIRGAVFANGHLSLPDVRGTLLMEQTSFEGSVTFEANHHCGVGVTGMLCNPQYVFLNSTWQVTGENTFQFLAENDAGVFALAPPDAANAEGRIFPTGYQALVGGSKTYLLALDHGATCRTATEVVGESAAGRYGHGILCRKPVRRLNVWSRAQTSAGAPRLQLEVLQDGVAVATGLVEYWQIGNDGDTKKQGYPMAVTVTDAEETNSTTVYRLSLEGGGEIPSDWVIEFSDRIMGHRFGVEFIHLEAAGRECGNKTSSQHDRRWLDGNQDGDERQHGDDDAGGRARGACSGWDDMPEVACSSVAALQLPDCPEECPEGCPDNAYCACGRGACLCQAGFLGDSCATDVCASARCGAHGRCTGRYLGGDLPAVAAVCTCDEGWSGLTCKANPCEGNPCGEHGTCVALSETNYRCECESSWSGEDCSETCDDVCQGSYPYNCNTGLSPAFCLSYGGCSYSTSSFDSADACCINGCDPCADVVCPSTDNQCMSPGVCRNGIGPWTLPVTCPSLSLKSPPPA